MFNIINIDVEKNNAKNPWFIVNQQFVILEKIVMKLVLANWLTKGDN